MSGIERYGSALVMVKAARQEVEEQIKQFRDAVTKLSEWETLAKDPVQGPQTLGHGAPTWDGLRNTITRWRDLSRDTAELHRSLTSEERAMIQVLKE